MQALWDVILLHPCFSTVLFGGVLWLLAGVVAVGIIRDGEIQESRRYRPSLWVQPLPLRDTMFLICWGLLSLLLALCRVHARGLKVGFTWKIPPDGAHHN